MCVNSAIYWHCVERLSEIDNNCKLRTKHTMPAAKCGGCAKFLSPIEAAKCSHCNAFYHRACVGLPSMGIIAPTWRCPECGKNLVRDNKTETPVRGRVEPAQEEEHSSPEELVNSPLHGTACKVTSYFSPDLADELRLFKEERDQELLLNDIELTGIPECKGENALHLVGVLAIKLGVAIDERDVVHAERVGSTRRNRVETSDGAISTDPTAQRPRCISVRLARRATRDALLRAARVYRGLSTGDLDITGPPHRVYVNERLTRTNRQLFYHARQAGFQKKWKYVWTREGRILARREDHQKAERIRCAEDISRIFG